MNRRILITLSAAWLASISQSSAGMTVVTLTDMARLRLDALSFFVFVYLVVTWVVKWLWNQLSETFTVLPKLNYRKALALVFLSGLLFYVVLTMISGARELLTPGAWEKQGVGYRLREGGVTEFGKNERRDRLRKLQDAIWSYANSHEGKAPASPMVPGTDPQIWRFPGGGFYCMMPDVSPGVGRDVLVYEPSTAGPRRFVLLADGSIEDRSEGTLKTQLDEQLKR